MKTENQKTEAKTPAFKRCQWRLVRLILMIKIRLPKTPSYEPGNRVNSDRLAFESNLTTGMILKEFVCMGITTTKQVDGIMCFGHTEIWRCERDGGDFDGATWHGDVFFPHGVLPNMEVSRAH